jgi:tyrosinase
VHYSGTFLGWHRYYLHIYEKALREECGFKGTLPYWEWSKYADAPQNSPIFNGDAYSMSGNGEYIPGHPGVKLLPAFEGLGDEPIYLDAGLGGG